jgi:hypothetical protein
MVYKKIIFILLAAQLSFSQATGTIEQDIPGAIESDNSKEAIQKKEAIKDETETTVQVRSSKQLRYTKPVGAGISWAPVSMWMPSKIGGSVSYNFSDKRTIVGQFESASIKVPTFKIDLGGIRESKYGVVLKSFGDSNSFYLSYGLLRYSFNASLNLSLFPVSVPIAPVFDINSFGFQFGMGNQWSWENGLSLGIDWFSIYFHSFGKSKNTEIFGYMNQNDRDNANALVDAIYNIPLIEVLKIQLMYGF